MPPRFPSLTRTPGTCAPHWGHFGAYCSSANALPPLALPPPELLPGLGRRRMPAELPAGRYLPAGPVSGSCPRPGSGHPRPSVPSLRGTSRRRRRPEAAFLRTERKRDSLTDRCPENRKQRCRAPAALPPHPGLPEALPVPLPGGGAARGPPKHGRGNPGPQNPSPPRGHHLPFHRREPEAPGLCRAPGLYPRPGAPTRPGIGGHKGCPAPVPTPP